MSKKILFMNSAKLTAFSIGLLLAVFCTIGMSFTPGDEDGIVEPNDTTALAGRPGPRKSHWTETGCSTTYKNKKDYGKVVITVVGTGGTISASGNNSTSSTSNNNSTSVTVTWNCGYDGDGQKSDLVAKHTNSITYTAHPASGYQLEGWYTDAECTTLVSNNPEDFVIGHSSYESDQNNEYEGANKAQTWNRYAKFVKDEPVDLTFIAPGAGGSYTVTVSGSSSTVSSANVVKTGITTEVALVATPVSGYIFAGWYQIDGEGNVGDLSTDASYNKKFAKSVSVGARFISTSTPKFKNITKNVEYYGLRQATLAASAGDKIIPVADCTVDGSDLVAGESYTIPAGVTLLIPFDANNTCYTTAPGNVNPAAGAPGPYRTLTLAEGVKINVEGAISVSAKQYGTGTTAGQSGVRDKYGFIDMNAGSEIILKNGANLYAWGYISGDGEITAKDGANIYEMFQITDFRGGNATSNIEGNNYKVFPFSQYYIQNIEATLHVEYGATEYVRALIAMSSSTYPGSATLIGKSSALFTMSSGCVLTKKYDRLTDRIHYSLNGNASLSALKLSISGLPLIGTLNLDTKDYVLPLNGGMSINIESNKTLTVSQDLAILPGAEVNIATGAKMVLSSGFNIYAYDEADWKGKNYVYSGVDVKPLPYVARNHVNVAGAPKPRSLGDDAKFVVDGGIEATGGFYTTTGGADICSSGTGFFKFVTNAAPANKNTYQVYQDGNKVSSWPAIPVTSAQLHNADGSYTTTAGVPANTTINYKHGHWGWKVIWRLEDGTELKRAYYYKQPDATWISNNKPAETHPDAGTSSCTYTFNRWNQETISAQQEIEITADFTKTCPNYYEVIWKSEDGSATLETDASVGEGEATNFNGTVPAKATNWTTYTEYEFDGWSTEPNGGGTHYANGATPAATANATYYAHFKAIGMAASVTVSGQEPEIYKTLPEAFDAAVTKPNCTIKILNDVSGITSRLLYDRPNGICTLDLNNHTVSGAVPYTNTTIIGGLIVINASGANFTITDNSDDKNGRLENIKEQNQVTYGVLVTAGTLDIDTGTVYVENPAQYASKAATVNSVAVTALTSCGARAVQVAAGQTFNFKKGLLEAHATRNAYGIVATGNTANTTKVTLTGGKVYAEAPCGAYGISCTGKLDMSAGLVEAKLNDHLVDASYTATDASNNLNKHQSCYGIIMNGYANATASSCYFGTLTVTGGKIKASSDLVRSYTSNVYGIYMNVSVAGMGNRNNASTSKTNSEQACSKGSIKNATVEVQNNGNYGYGIIVLGKYNSKDKSNTTIKVENTNVTVKAYNNAYGIYASGAINGTTGECSSSDVELTNCTVWAEAEKAAGAYATWVWTGQTTIYKNSQANYYGEYAAGAKMTINSGTYTAKTKTSTAYATGTSLRAKSIFDPTISTEAERTPGEGKEAFATLIINGGTFNAEATTTTARGVSSGGNTTIKDATFNVVAGTYQAYGLYAQSGKLTATNVIVNDTAKGRYSGSNDDAYAYGAMADISTIGSGNQAWTGYTCAGEIELNNCTINAVASTYRSARGVMVNAGSVMMTRANFEAQKTSSGWSTATYNAYNSVFPVQVQGKDSIWIGIAAKATVNGGTYTVRTKTTSAYGAFNTRALKYSYTTPNTILEEFQGTLDINNATFDVQTEGTTTAEGVRSYGQTTITGGSFTVQPKSTTAYGIKVYSGKTTVNGNPTFTVKATKTACGIIAGGGEAPHSKLGYGYDGEVEVNGGTFNVETTEDKPAYGVWVYANSTPITSTAAGYYAGNYASAGKAVINDGEFNVKSKKTEAYGIYMSPAVSQSGATGYETATATPVCEVNGGTFTAEGTTDIAYGAYVSNGVTLTVTDGTFKGKLTAVAADKFAVGAYIAAGGILNATGGAFEAEAAKTGLSSKQKSYACGLYSPDGTATISASNATFKGELKSTYLSNGDATTWSGGAYGFYARTTNPLSLTNCTITGNSAYQGGFGLRFANTPAEVRNCTINVTTTYAYNYGLFVGGASCDVKLYDCSFTCTSGTTYAYGIYAYNGATYAENCTIDATVQRTGASSEADSYLYGVLVASGKTATLKDCSITATGSGKYSNNGYGVYVDGTANLDNCDVTVSNINSGAYALFNTSNTTLLNVASGKYKATATSGAASTNGTAAAAKQTLNGGYYSHNTNLSKYAVSPKKVITLRPTHSLYPDYKYTINEGGTVTWKNGSTTLKTEMYESGETPAYTGDTPTQEATAQYSYTHNGWTPTVEEMANADKTYTATFAQTEVKYTVTVVAGANGSASPASVSNIGCETASGDITATANTGYKFVDWTLPDGVTAATGYTAISNPIRIHATATGTITANFAAKTYTVTLDNQEATTAGAANVTATYSATMPSIAANLPAKTGYTFGGYYSAANGGGSQYYNNDGTSAHVWDIDAASPTLYAKWTIIPYTITLHRNNGTINSGNVTSYTYGTGATLPIDVTRNNHTFLGWYAASDFSGEPVSEISTTETGDKEFWARWKVNNHDVTFNANGHGTAPATQSIPHGSTAEKPSDPSATGYTFGGWYKESSCTNAWNFTSDVVNDETTLYAKWTLINYTINYVLDGGNVTSNPTSYTIESSAIILNNPTKEGYTFAGWTGSNGDTPLKPITIAHGSTGNKSYTANWLKNYTVTWEVDGKVVRTDQVADGHTPNYDPDPTKASDEQYDYSFAGWSPDIVAVSGADQTYTGSFKANTHYYTITWQNWDGTVLETDNEPTDAVPAGMHYGAIISYDGAEPTKVDPSGKVTYTFIGWSPAFVEGDLVAHDQIYTAQFRGDIVASENSSEPVTISVPTTDIVTTTVETTGKLNIQSTGSLTTNTLILQATSGDGNTNNATNATSGEITGAEYIKTTNTNVYFDLTLNSWARHWHAFGVPWPVDLKNDQLIEIKDIKGNEVNHPLIFGRDVDILYYDGNERATNGPSPACWKYVEDDPSWVLQPGVAYMIGLPIHVGTIRFPKKADQQIAFDGNINVTNYGGDDTNHNHGWNSVANPTTFHALLNVGEDVTECQVYNGDTIGSDGYTPYDMSDKKFVVGQAVYVQVRAPKTVLIDKATSQEGISPLAAPRRSQGVSASERLEVQIAPVDAPMADRIYLMADEDKEDHYIITRDLSKAGLSTVRAQMWINRYGLKLCKNTTALRNNQATYPLGISVPQAGEYEISSPAGENGDMLYLTYDGRIIWNLTYAPYSASFEKGTNTRYGLKLVRSNAPAVTTDMEQLSGDNASSPIQKVLIDDQVYVLRGEEIYTITGQKAK